MLGLGEQVGHGELPAAHHQRRVERDPACEPAVADTDAALRQVAEPLVGMALAHRAALLDERDHAWRAGAEFPAHQRTAIEQVAEGRGGASLGGERKVGAEGEDAVDHLPRSVNPGVEETLVAGVAEHGVDSPTELVASGGNRHARQGGGTIFAATAADGECCAGQERLRESGGNRGAGWCVMHEQAGGAGGSAAGLS